MINRYFQFLQVKFGKKLLTLREPCNTVKKKNKRMASTRWSEATLSK